MYTHTYVNTHTDTQRKVCLGDASSRGNEVAKEDTGSTLGQEDQTPPASGPQEREEALAQFCTMPTQGSCNPSLAIL